MNLNDILLATLDLTEANRPIRLRLAHDQGLLDDVLLVRRVSGSETLCGGLEYRLLCVAANAYLPLKEFIALPVELQFVTDRGELRSVCGIVAQVSAGQSDGGLATYQLVIRDALALLELRTNTRVFRTLNEVDIAKVVLDDMRQNNPVLAKAFDIDFSSLSQTYPAREFTMQHNESDAAFLRRLWKRRGIAWFIRPGKASASGSTDTPTHTLVLFDDQHGLARNAAGTVRYHRDGATETRDGITAWMPVRTLTPGGVSRHSRDYLQARPMTSASPSCIDQGSTGNQFAASLEDYLLDVPHAGDSGDDYRRLGELRMKRHEYESKCFHGEGGVRDLCVGQWIGLSGHPEIDTHPPEEREFVITELHVEADNNLPKTLDDTAQRLFAANRWNLPPTAVVPGSTEAAETRYRNRFACVRRGVPIVPAFDPRTDLPRPQLQSAIVVGPAGEEIHCDPYGRVKVAFDGTRPRDHEHAHGAGASQSDRDSAWVRVSSNWAGDRRGALSLPRVGDEVIVDWLGGDPDKPIVISSVYGGTAPPPDFSRVGGLPGNRYVAGIKSKEVRGRRYNQLRLDDTPGQINAQLASEHGHSQLNLGWLTHPRQDGQGEARGEGAELRSDGATAIRGGKGVFISADARPKAAGTQLDRTAMLGMNEVLASIQRSLTELARTHFADDADGTALAKLVDHLKNWDKGSNTEGGEPDPAGGKPVVAVSAVEGLALTSQENIAIGARTHVDVVSGDNTQLSTGKKLLMRAAQGVSLFAHKLGMKLIAASGKIEIQAQDGEIAIGAARRLHLYSLKSLLLEAPEIMIRSEGAQIVLANGTITSSSTGTFKIEAPDFSFGGSGGGSLNPPSMPQSSLATDERIAFSGRAGQARENIAYEVRDASGAVRDAGRSAADGATQAVVTDSAIQPLNIHIKL